MATNLTGSFWLSETIQIPAGTASGGRVQGTFDLGAYIDVGDSQAVAIEEYNVILQVDADYGAAFQNMVAGDASIGTQLSELNPGTLFVRADNNNLIASSSVSIDSSANMATLVADIFPDTFGKDEESRIVINDTLYGVVGVDGAASAAARIVYVTLRIKCRIIKMTKQSWMTKAIEAFGADN
ncbi:MAG TPA: hypothetical protein EYO33_13620 [Phycisphaerales bacterium]|nr:hypothetical protein [Phycisphaerales bacterium]